VECGIFLKNALSEKAGVGAHVVVDRAKFGHGNSSVKGRGDSKTKVKRKRKKGN
jgi:hypothetical protein